jgi:hypothetical protein
MVVGSTVHMLPTTQRPSSVAPLGATDDARAVAELVPINTSTDRRSR